MLMNQTLNGLGIGADEYVLAVDAQQGVLLRSEARLHAHPFKVIEMTEVAFDVDIPADTFALVLPAGETFEDTAMPRSRAKQRRRPLMHLRRRSD